MNRQEKDVNIGKHVIRVRELSMEDEAKARANSQVWNQSKKVFEVDNSKFELEVILRSIVPSSWPTEWGSLSFESLRNMGAKYLRPVLKAWRDLNILSEETADFLESQSPSETNPRPSQVQ
jgi:hypothetical protein